MRIGLVSFQCENRNIRFNMNQIERAMKCCAGNADLLCFGEAFLQGFDAFCWHYEIDQSVAAELSSETFAQLKRWTIQYGVALIIGYLEKDQEKLYSSCAVISEGRIIHNYRRISKGWKEFSKTDAHYCEGKEVQSFQLCGKDMMLALCGDLWDFPERFKTKHLLIWPVFVDFTPEEWNNGMIEEYAEQAALAADDTLMVNPIDRNSVNHGGSFHFHKGRTAAKLPFDEEGILILEV